MYVGLKLCKVVKNIYETNVWVYWIREY